MRHITCSLKPSFAHENCLIFAGIGSGLHCYQFLIFTYAYALIFIHRCFGSLFWLLGVHIRYLFHKKGVLIGSLSLRLGVLISFGGSAIPLYTTHRYMCEKLTRCLLGLEAHISIFLHRCLDRHSFKSQTTDVCLAIFLTHHFQLANSNKKI